MRRKMLIVKKWIHILYTGLVSGLFYTTRDASTPTQGRHTFGSHSHAAPMLDQLPNLLQKGDELRELMRSKGVGVVRLRRVYAAVVPAAQQCADDQVAKRPALESTYVHAVYQLTATGKFR